MELYLQQEVLGAWGLQKRMWKELQSPLQSIEAELQCDERAFLLYIPGPSSIPTIIKSKDKHAWDK